MARPFEFARPPDDSGKVIDIMSSQPVTCSSPRDHRPGQHCAVIDFHSTSILLRQRRSCTHHLDDRTAPRLGVRSSVQDRILFIVGGIATVASLGKAVCFP